MIGTLATLQPSKRDFHTMIVSGDKDLAQLVGERVEMVDTMKNTRLDPGGVAEKFGVPPERIVEYLALMGDSCGQHSRHSRGRAEDRGEMAHRIRLPGTGGRARR